MPSLVCPNCGEEENFEATATALYTVFLNGKLEAVDTKNYDHVPEDGYRDVQCSSCHWHIADRIPDEELEDYSRYLSSTPET